MSCCFLYLRHHTLDAWKKRIAMFFSSATLCKLVAQVPRPRRRRADTMARAWVLVPLCGDLGLVFAALLRGNLLRAVR